MVIFRTAPFLSSMILSCFFLTPLQAEEKDDPMRYEDTDSYMRVIVRTPEQLSAFYQGRHFKKEAIRKILDTCFITPIIKNKTFDAMWVDLDQWQFFRGDEKINRIKRDYWETQWDEVALQQAHRSTFGWTLMPEVRDLRLDEGVGGSVVIPWQAKPFSLVARFTTGFDRKGPVKEIRFDGVRCDSK